MSAIGNSIGKSVRFSVTLVVSSGAVSLKHNIIRIYNIGTVG